MNNAKITIFRHSKLNIFIFSQPKKNRLMKENKFIILALIAMIIISSCSTLNISPKKESYVVDFRKFLNDGFRIYITNQIEENKYQTLGTFEFDFTEGAQNNPDAFFGGPPYIYSQIPFDQMLNEVVAKVKEMGGNGILSFNLRTEPRYVSDDKKGLSVKSIIITGIAVKF